MRVCVTVSKIVTFRGVFLGVLCVLCLVGCCIVTLGRRAILAFILSCAATLFSVIVLRLQDGLSAIQGISDIRPY